MLMDGALRLSPSGRDDGQRSKGSASRSKRPPLRTQLSNATSSIVDRARGCAISKALASATAGSSGLSAGCTSKRCRNKVTIGASLRAPKPASPSRQNKGKALITASLGRCDGAAWKGASRASQQVNRAATQRMSPAHIRRARQMPAMTANPITSAKPPTSVIFGYDDPASTLKISTVPKLPTPAQMAKRQPRFSVSNTATSVSTSAGQVQLCKSTCPVRNKGERPPSKTSSGPEHSIRNVRNAIFMQCAYLCR